MNAEQIDGLIRGATVYHRLTDGSPHGAGEVAFYFEPDGRAVARFPSGKIQTGAWQIEGDVYRLDWDGGLQNSRSSLTKEDGAIVVRNASDGVVRSRIIRIVPGNAEGL
ncbi:hypothetical protein VB618_07230 [Microvirga sp. CF3062]|uniref:hypothetical protein n=1 Tax=Microvirga sp. CF3062 TaxID=3110182 RepID=UPI002E784F87|nr:hypothetical protein [Microvirga sp. CF3062]MEE1655983.1 hypothetical protein [Microvirga sp. CF3062]